MYFHLFALPVIKIRIPSAVQGITKNDLTVFGAFPNPATNETNFKFSLAKNADVRVELVDMTGRNLRMLHNGSMTAGEHAIRIETADLAAGNYLVMVRTSGNEGMAIQMTVAK